MANKINAGCTRPQLTAFKIKWFKRIYPLKIIIIEMWRREWASETNHRDLVDLDMNLKHSVTLHKHVTWTVHKCMCIAVSLVFGMRELSLWAGRYTVNWIQAHTRTQKSLHKNQSRKTIRIRFVRLPLHLNQSCMLKLEATALTYYTGKRAREQVVEKGFRGTVKFNSSMNLNAWANPRSKFEMPKYQLNFVFIHI